VLLRKSNAPVTFQPTGKGLRDHETKGMGRKAKAKSEEGTSRNIAAAELTWRPKASSAIS